MARVRDDNSITSAPTTKATEDEAAQNVRDAIANVGGQNEIAEEKFDFEKIFRSESFVTESDLRVETARTMRRTVIGNETIEVDYHKLHSKGDLTAMRGQRERTVGRFVRSVDNEDTYAVEESWTETVGGGVNVQIAFASDVMVGGAYVQVLAGPVMRMAAWIDYLAWGGWAEIDVIRVEMALAMIRSHAGYAHAAGVRATIASRLIDDFQNRNEIFGVFSESGATYSMAGAPGGGVVMEA